MFLIEDELHAERQDGEYPTLDAALAELRRRAGLPWDAQPNLAPCTGWRNCGRHYQVIEYDTSSSPWRELRRAELLRVSASGVEWVHPGALG